MLETKVSMQSSTDASYFFFPLNARKFGIRNWGKRCILNLNCDFGLQKKGFKEWITDDFNGAQRTIMIVIYTKIMKASSALMCSNLAGIGKRLTMWKSDE